MRVVFLLFSFWMLVYLFFFPPSHPHTHKCTNNNVWQWTKSSIKQREGTHSDDRRRQGNDDSSSLDIFLFIFKKVLYYLGVV